MSYQVIVPELVREARGLRERKVIVEAAGNAFTEQALFMWEKTGVQPQRRNIPPLLKGLGVPFNKIALPIEQVPSDSKFFLK